MNLRYITCSDPREHNSIKSVINLAKIPNIEIAVQCHPSKMSNGMPRNVWFNELLHVAKQIEETNLAIHINQEWANSIIVDGKIPDIILDWMMGEYYYEHPLIQRIQINMPKYGADNINPGAVAKIIHDFPNQEFIFQYNATTQDAVEKLHKTGARFSLLFDASGGRGIAPKQWQKPIYDAHPMGYSGGISPENVHQTLNEISKVLPKDYATWIDAEGKLKSLMLFEEKPAFDIYSARAYIKNAIQWQKKQR